MQGKSKIYHTPIALAAIGPASDINFPAQLKVLMHGVSNFLHLTSVCHTLYSVGATHNT